MKKFLAGMIVGIAVGVLCGWLIWGDVRIFGAPMCMDGTKPDKYGCCAGEVYTDMADFGFNCCPETGDACFPPIK